MTTSPQAERQRWLRETLEPSLRKDRERTTPFTTDSGHTVHTLYTDADVPSPDEHAAAYRSAGPAAGRHESWTIEQGGGRGLPEQANAWHKGLIADGASALHVTFDRSTLQGLDPDHDSAIGMVGDVGVSVATLEDMERLFDGIRLDSSVTLAAQETAPVIFGMYLVAAERRGVAWDTLTGTLQHDPLAERMVDPSPGASVRGAARLVTDVALFCARDVPAWQAVAVRGDRVRESGATAGQEVAFALSSALEYARLAAAAGASVARAPELSIVFDGGSDVFEEIAKYRAARRVWSSLMAQQTDTAKGRLPMLRILVHTAVAPAGESSYDNVVRSAMQGLAAALGGADSLQLRPFDDGSSRPAIDAARLAVRSQQVLWHESGLGDHTDPLAGSYYVETLTATLEREALDTIARIEEMGGMIAAIESGLPQREIGTGRRLAVDGLPNDAAALVQQERVRAWRARRDHAAVAASLDRLRDAVVYGRHVMPPILDAVRVHATLGEMSDVLKGASGVSELNHE